ncbi:MAG: hypothetical protein JRJ09_19020 [Deltaproteobacteria bacterium]|nr:hypothetical protein [Deltaproteobacteria bacterium]HDZ89819.1 hypothetical protein [Deltaproteobacteria bacterium]
MNDPRSTSARVVARECFWGDYQITAKELLDRLEADEPGFNRFLFSKIMENSSYPSRHIRALFHPGTWRSLLDRYLKNARNTRRVRLVAANLTGRYDLATEYKWRL